ncbi:MAG: MFS transporter [Dehalococcoidia bacterium]|nr:MFS transporter [Dehalococcoidia bacterium]MDW8119123.1 MFS transporter [Chloroflexota bacterium]
MDKATDKAVDSAPSSTHPEGARTAGLARTFLSLRHRDFRFLWMGTLSAGAALWIQQVTLGWLVYTLTGSAIQLGLINGMRTLPVWFMAPLAGVLADRWNRRPLLIGVEAILAVGAFLFALDVARGWVQVWHVYTFAFLMGCGTSFYQTLRQAAVPSTVPRVDLMNAIALSSAAFNFTRILGPAVGGALIALVGMAGNFFIQAGCYVWSAVSMASIRTPLPPGGEGRTQPIHRSFLEGVRYVQRDKQLLSLIVIGLLPFLLAMPVNSLMPIFAKDVLGMGPEGLGLLLSSLGGGALLGSLMLATMGNVRRKGLVAFLGLAMMGAGLVLFGFSRWLPLSIALLITVGAGQMTFMASNNTLIQMVVSDHYRGRVMSIYSLDQGLVPLGSLLAGVLATYITAPWAVVSMGGCLLLLGLAAAVALPSVRRL